MLNFKFNFVAFLSLPTNVLVALALRGFHYLAVVVLKSEDSPPVSMS